ncbi:MAG: hypothetical protein ABFD20_07940 [Anaerolineales bacterium]
MQIGYRLIGEGAQAPERRLGAALDLRVRLPGRGWAIVWGVARLPTGVALEMPDDAVVRITGRSSAFLRGLIVHDGLIESEFNGRELQVLVFSIWPRLIRHGDRIAQMWALPIDRDAFAPCAATEAQTESKAGFGSTGR